MLIDAFNIWLQIPAELLDPIKKVVNDLHAASLIMDDVEDNAPLRRGSPATHRVFGVSQSINSATYTVIRAVSEIAKLDVDDGGTMLKSILRDLENLFVGQSRDLYWTFHRRCPTEEEYFQMVDGKTGGLFQLALRIMLVVLAHQPREDHGIIQDTETTSEGLFTLARLLGRFFQVRDDYQNLVSDVYKGQKGTMEDLDEGKFSFPLILALKDSTSVQDHILGLMRESARPLSKESKDFILGLMRSSGALARTGRMLSDLQDEIERQIESLESRFGKKNEVMRGVVEKLGIIDHPVDG